MSRLGRPHGEGLPLSTHAPKRHSRGEHGFTLIELLIVIAILPLVVGAISIALLSVFKNEQPIANSLTASGDEQVTSAIFVQDIQGASWITNNSLDLCSGVSAPGTQLLLSVSPDDVASTSSIKNVTSYIEVPNSGSGSGTFTIKRETCTGGTGSPTTTTRVVSHNALASTAVTVSPTSLDISNWTAASGASNVQLQLDEPARQGTTNNYTLSAVPRLTGTPGSPPSGTQPILPLNIIGPNCPGVTFTGGYPAASLSLGNGSGTQGTGFYGTSQSQTSCPNPVAGSAPQFQASQPPYYNIGDPLAGLTPPAFPSLTGLNPGSCTATTCTSGLYGSNTTGGYSNGTISAGVTFDPSQGPKPGVVVFTVPVTANDGDIFDGGSPAVTGVTYWFQGGLTIADGATVTFGSATYIYGMSGGAGTVACQGSVPGNCVLQMGNHATIFVPVSSPGLLFYVPPGNANVSLNNGFTGTMSGALSPYEYVAIWDASTGLLDFGQGNGGGSGYSGGGIYDPSGTVSIAGGYKMQALFLVLNSMNIQTSNIAVTG